MKQYCNFNLARKKNNFHIPEKMSVYGRVIIILLLKIYIVNIQVKQDVYKRKY